MDTRPDILVLGGGGIAGIAWMAGVLAGIEDGSQVSLASCDYVVGTSAGSVVAAHLVGGSRLPRPPANDEVAVQGHQAPGPSAFTNWALALGGPAASIGIRVATPPAALARAAVLRFVPGGREPIGPVLGGSALFDSIDAGGGPIVSAASAHPDPTSAQADTPATGAVWDGRLRVVAVERRSGRRVVFGSPGAPDATVDEAVQASCSVPWIFAPVSIGGVEYVDGGVWSPTSLDVAPARREARVLCLCPTAGLHGPLPLPTRAASRTATLVEAATLARRGAHVQIIAPDRDSAAAIGRDLMASEPAAEILAAAYRQGLTI